MLTYTIMKFKIALAQINPTVGDLDDNARKIIRNIKKAQEQGADLVVFPELAITGTQYDIAKVLAEGLSKIGIKVVNEVQTNMVYVDFSPIGWTAEDWNKACADLGWKSRGRGTGTRLVTHYGIEEEDIRGFLEGIAKLV